MTYNYDMTRATLAWIVAAAATLGACGDDGSSCQFGEFDEPRVESVAAEGEGVEVIASFQPSAGEELDDAFYVEHMVPLEHPDGLVVEVLADRRVSVTYPAEPYSTDVLFEIGGCRYGDRFEITMSLDFDADPDGAVAFEETASELGSCITVSPAGPRGSLWVGLLFAATGALGLSRVRRSTRRD